MKMSLFALILISILLSNHTFASAPQFLPPVDEGIRDLEFMAFRSKLLEAVARKEPEAFVTMVNPRIFNGLAAKRGMKQFMNLWEPESINSEIWITLEPILKMGGAFIRSERGVEFCAPYVFTHFPDELDIFAHGAVIKENISLKLKPSISSRTVKKLSYDLIQVLDWVSIADTSGAGHQWLKVTTMTGEQGYIDKHNVRSPSDYSACFVKTKHTGWKLDSLLSIE